MVKLKLRLSRTHEPIPFTYPHRLTGVFHRWMGSNTLHDAMSLYSLGWLRGGRAKQQHLVFPHGANWFVGFAHKAHALTFMEGLFRDPRLFAGMKAIEVQKLPLPAENRVRFWLDSPVVLRTRREDGRRVYVSYEEPESDMLLERIAQKKLKRLEMDAYVHLCFDRSYPRARTKLIQIKNVRHRANLCPVLAEGNPMAIAMLFCIGLGELTGSGFGSILRAEPL